MLRLPAVMPLPVSDGGLLLNLSQHVIPLHADRPRPTRQDLLSPLETETAAPGPRATSLPAWLLL